MQRPRRIVGTIRRDLPIPQPSPAPLEDRTPNNFSSMRAAPLPPSQTPAAPPPAPIRTTAAPSSPSTQRGARGPLPEPPSTQSMRQAFNNQPTSQTPGSRLSGNGNGSHSVDSPKNGKGSEIYGTIRNVAPAAAVVASAHTREVALLGSDSLESVSSGKEEPRSTIATVPQQVATEIFRGEAEMDDVVLNSVIIPAIESVRHV